MKKIGIAILLFGALTLAGHNFALAQNVRVDPNSKSDQNQAVARPLLVAPYDKKLMRLAEVLGSIHYLRELCKADEGQLWRTKMAALIDAEQPKPARRSRMISRFNRGYGAFNRTYRACTQSALVAINRYMKEGVLLTSQINTRYGR